MSIKKQKQRFRDNLQQFITLKKAGKLDGSAAQIEEKLRAAARTLDLDYAKELKEIRPTMGAGFEDYNTQNSNKRENPCGCGTRSNPSDFIYGLESKAPAGTTLRENKGVKPEEIYDMITDMVINTIEKNGHLPWQKSWDDSPLSGGLTATNFVSKKGYRGINFFLLNFRQVMNEDGEMTLQMINFENPYFLTFNQVDDRNGKVKAGAKGQRVVYFTKLYKIEQVNPDIDFGTYSFDKMVNFIKENYNDIKNTAGREPEQIANSSYLPILKYYNVFHASDIEGIDWGTLPKNENADKSVEGKIAAAKQIYEYFPGAPKVVNQRPNATYRLNDDVINMPPIGRFSEEQFYHTTLFHEAVHSTGHESRVGRKMPKRYDNTYAFEELIAEMGAVFLCAESGILFKTIDNSAAYLDNWNKRLIEKLSNDNKFFFRAASQAQAAADYILDRNKDGIPAYRAKQQEPAPAAARPNPKAKAESLLHDTIVHAQRLQNFGHDNSADLEKLDLLLGPDGWKWNDKKTQIIRLNDEIRTNPAARFIYIGLCERIIIDQGQPEPITLKSTLAMLTNKKMNKLFIVPMQLMENYNGSVEDVAADDVFALWHNYNADDTNYVFDWPSRKKSRPVGTASEIYYISDKVMQETDAPGKDNLYHHIFDAGKRPCVVKGNILIVSNLSINERGILN